MQVGSTVLNSGCLLHLEGKLFDRSSEGIGGAGKSALIFRRCTQPTQKRAGELNKAKHNKLLKLGLSFMRILCGNLSKHPLFEKHMSVKISPVVVLG